MQLDSADRLHLIQNGLNDYEQEVRDACRDYIISQICVYKASKKN